MTDKQIIIDGVDVSGCKFYNTDDKTCREVNGKYDTDICEFDKCENSNCYFKQLARKTQECEELKEQYIWFDHYKEQALFNKELCNKKSDELDQLKASKEQAEQKLERIEAYCKEQNLKADYTACEILQIIDEVE